MVEAARACESQKESKKSNVLKEMYIMPNLCDYEIKVQGKEEDVKEFVKILKADYYIDENGVDSCERHFWRVFEADVIDEGMENGIYYNLVAGYCAWSVYSCMAEGTFTYNDDNPNCGGTSLQKESERLHLIIEVFSEECGCAFMEHFVYKNGETLVYDCVEWNEYPTEDFDTVEEMNDEYGTTFTQEEFENNNFLSTGGMKWNFGNY